MKALLHAKGWGEGVSKHSFAGSNLQKDDAFRAQCLWMLRRGGPHPVIFEIGSDVPD